MRLFKLAAQKLELLADYFNLRAAELSTGRTLVEAVALEERYTQLLLITGSAQASQDVLDSAVELAKAGVHPEEVAPMLRLWFAPPSRAEVTLIKVRRALEDSQ